MVMSEHAMKPIWYFVGLILTIIGALDHGEWNLSSDQPAGGEDGSCRTFTPIFGGVHS